MEFDPKGVMAELTGKKTGYSKGKGGSMHMFSKSKDFYGGHGIVGAQVPIGAGLAFSTNTKNKLYVYLFWRWCTTRQIYETFNMALEITSCFYNRE